MSALAPAIKLANSIPFTQKLLIIIISFLLPCGFLLVKDLSHKQTDMANYQQHIEGINLALGLKTLMLEVAKHRGNMAQYLAGDATKKNVLIGIENDTNTITKTLMMELEAAGFDNHFLKEFDTQWKKLQVNGISIDAKSSFNLHTQLVANISRSLNQLVAYFDLELQNVASEYYLVQISLSDIPSMQELIGQLRGKGAGALADKQLTKEEITQLDNLQSSLSILLNRYQASTELLSVQTGIWKNLQKSDADFKQKLNNFFTLTQNLIANPETITTTNSDYFAAGTLVITDISTLDKLASEYLLQTSNNKLSAAVQARNWEIMIALLILGFGCYLAAGAVVAMNLSVKQLTLATEKLKSGDFTYSPQVDSKDVIGDVSQHLAEVISQVSSLLQQIKNSASQVNRLSNELQDSTMTVRTELDQQNNQTIQAASASTQMAATVREVARNCQDARTATENARDKALDGEIKVKEAINKINRLGSDVETAQENISHLQGDVSSISAVLEVIRSIAEQTNLLALNAAIEAARAGEQGRGFAVVADEVRSLAKRTQDSTAEIKMVIERLQKRAENAVTIINQSYQGAQASVASAADAGNHLHEIVKSVELMSDYNTQIASSAEEQAATADQMSRNTQQLSDSADEILKQVFKTQAFSQELQENANLLHQNVSKFKV